MSIHDELTEAGVPFTTHQHTAAYTAQMMAAEEHVSGKRVAKPVIVATDKGYAMCVVPANRKLDLDKAGKALRAREIRLADEKEMASLFPDMEVGAEAPFGERFGMATLVDHRLIEGDQIAFQADSHRQTIHMNTGDFVRVTSPEQADLVLGR